MHFKRRLSVEVLNEDDSCIMVTPDYDAESRRDYEVLLRRKNIEIESKILIIKDGIYYRVYS